MCEVLHPISRKAGSVDNIHRPSRIVIQFEGRPLPPGAFLRMREDKTDYRKLFIVEAEATYWWLHEQGLWKTSPLATKMRVRTDKKGTRKEVVIYPIFDDVGCASDIEEAEFFIGLDTRVYCIDDDGIELFNPEASDAHAEVVYLVERLRMLRGE